MASPDQNPDNLAGDALATASGAATSWLSGIPTPIRQNAFKAFGQLCTAAIDIPVAMLEGVAAEKRAETQARVKIISTGADQIAAQMSVGPEYARAAVKKYGERIVREQMNLDKASEIAALELKNAPLRIGNGEDASRVTAPIDDDWLNNFEKEASQKSTEDMQRMFGRILAGEIRKPSSFSIKTVKLLGQIDVQTANLFRVLCSLSVSLRVANGPIIDARVPSLGGNPGSNALLKYGLSYGQLTILQEYGLITPDYNSHIEFDLCIAKEGEVAFAFTYGNSAWTLIPSQERVEGPKLLLNGVSLSRSGKELLGIVDLAPNDEYTAALQQFFINKKLTMVEARSDSQPKREG